MPTQFGEPVSFSDEDLFCFTQSANVLHQSINLILTEPSPERRHIASSVSYYLRHLLIRLLLNLRGVKIRSMQALSHRTSTSIGTMTGGTARFVRAGCRIARRLAEPKSRGAC